MNILVFGMNYVPEKTAIGPLTADMCQDLVARDHQVTMVTGFPHFPEWRVYDGYRSKLFARETRHGVRVRRGFVYVPGKPGPRQRVMYDSSISLSAALNLIGVSRPDVIVVISPPLQLALTALAAGKLWRAPVLLVIKDIVPDVAISLGMLKNRGIIGIARALERFCYQHADRISVIGDGFIRNLLSKGVPTEKLSLIPDWVDTNLVYPMERVNSFRRRHGIPADTCLVLYSGNMSFKQGLDNVISAAERLQDRPDVQFCLTGQGAARSALEEMVKHRRLTNVSFLPFEPEETYPEMLAAADILLLSQRADVGDAVLPCKFLNYMAAGRPIVSAVSAESETAVYMRKADCGRLVPPEEPAALAEAISDLFGDQVLRALLGTNGRRFVEAQFSREQVLQSYADLIESMARRRTE